MAVKDNTPNIEDNEISIKELILGFSSTITYLKKKWFLILIAILLGAVIGLGYALIQPVKYTSRLTFVLEESKGGMGGLASLAGQFGVDFGGSSGGGIFNPDNILLFLKSKALVRETLLSNYNNQKITLVDKYIESYQLKDKWKNKQGLATISFFGKTGNSLPRLEDSVLQVLTSKIIKEELSVLRPDKKASFIEVSSTMQDEVLSKLFCDRLVSLALDRYIVSKVKVKETNVQILQNRADSLERLLNARTFNAAASQQSLLDINPGLRVAAANPEIRTREKMTVAAIYTEVVKNLELAKTILNQETPTIELVDQSSFPLHKVKTSKLAFTVGIGLGFGLFIILVLLVRRWWKRQMLT